MIYCRYRVFNFGFIVFGVGKIVVDELDLILVFWSL